MATNGSATITDQQSGWDRLARNALLRRKLILWAVGLFLLLVSLPILLPYFWMLTISVSARTGGVDSIVLWKSCAVLAPALFAIGIWINIATSRKYRIAGAMAIVVVSASHFACRHRSQPSS